MEGRERKKTEKICEIEEGERETGEGGKKGEGGKRGEGGKKGERVEKGTKEESSFELNMG